MKHTSKFCSLAATLFTFGHLTVGANAALQLLVEEYTTDAVTLTLSGTFDADSLGSSPGYLAVKNDWSNNVGTSTEWALGTPTVDFRTVQIGGVTPSFSANFAGLTNYSDSVHWFISSSVPFTAGTAVSGSIRLTGAGMFDPSDIATLELVSGFNPTTTQDWVRLEASAVSSIPEPTSALLFGLAALGFSVRRRR